VTRDEKVAAFLRLFRLTQDPGRGAPLSNFSKSWPIKTRRRAKGRPARGRTAARPTLWPVHGNRRKPQLNYKAIEVVSS